MGGCVSKKNMAKLEKVTGMDLDGDGRVGTVAGTGAGMTTQQTTALNTLKKNVPGAGGQTGNAAYAPAFVDHAPSGTPEEAPLPLISSTDEFIQVRDRIGQTPRGGAILFIHALINWANMNTRTLGEEMMVLSLSEDELVQGSTYKGYALHRANADRLKHIDHCLYVANSYSANTTKEKRYELPANKQIIVHFRLQDKYVGSEAEGAYKVFIWSTGAASARPLALVRNPKGFWKVKEFSSLVVEIMKPDDGKMAAAANDL